MSLLVECREGTEEKELMFNPNKLNVICRQLSLILHSKDCKAVVCVDPNCKLMKNLLIHMKSCTDGNRCPIKHCRSSQTILSHWESRRCGRSCPVCQRQRSVSHRTVNTGLAYTTIGRPSHSITDGFIPETVMMSIPTSIINLAHHYYSTGRSPLGTNTFQLSLPSLPRLSPSLVQIRVNSSEEVKSSPDKNDINGLSQGFDCMVLDSVIDYNSE